MARMLLVVSVGLLLLCAVASLGVTASSAAMSTSLPSVKVTWNTSLLLGMNEVLSQVSAPLVARNFVFASDEFNISVVDRTSGTFVRNIDCSNNGNCVMFPGGTTTGDDVVVMPKLGNVTAYDGRTGKIVWHRVLPCQPSAFEGMILSRPAPDGTILAACDQAMNPILLNGTTGETIAQAPTNAAGIFGSGLARPVFVPRGAHVNQSMWIWTGADTTAALGHPDLLLLWRQDNAGFGLNEPQINLARGEAYILDDSNNVDALEINTGAIRFASSSMCNNQLQLIRDRFLTCWVPNPEGNVAQLEIRDVEGTGAITATMNLKNNCYGGIVAVPTEGPTSSLAAVGECSVLTFVDLQSGEVLGAATINTPYFQSSGINLGSVVDHTLYLTTVGTAMAVTFFKG